MSKLIIALDVVNIDAARHLIEQTCDYCELYKIGWPFFMAHGRVGIEKLYNEFNIDILFDVKFYDPPHTVSHTVALMPTYSGIKMFTVHRSMVAAAMMAKSTAQIIATVALTSDNKTGKDIAFRAFSAIRQGAAGVTCSGHAAKFVRDKIDTGKLIICPGFRLDENSNDDHSKAVTLAEASTMPEVNYWVVGRPIINSADPGNMAKIIASEIVQE
ncbi:MAG TPA: orotidine 5'-phosphate decarboxylase / HUMPS family protein [Nitrosopumilaceae archaeon]|jgi:orotidine-5'-phosphate decarboxylase|nr:orotidine 5'-phosphate decarboxylase / HUMPS family protein [Nitrosopumilaceae archaeon]